MNIPIMLQCSFVSIVGLLCLFSGNAIANPITSTSHQLSSGAVFTQNQTTKPEPPVPSTVSTTPY